MSPDAAIAELDHIQEQYVDDQPPSMLTAWCDIASAHSDNSAVAAKATEAICDAVRNNPRNAAAAVGAGVIPVVLALMARHVPSEHVQGRGCWALRLLVGAHPAAADAIASNEGFDGRLYVAMEAHLTSGLVQGNACLAIERIAKHSVTGKMVLVSGRAVEVCTRAVRVTQDSAYDALAVLTGTVSALIAACALMDVCLCFDWCDWCFN